MAKRIIRESNEFAQQDQWYKALQHKFNLLQLEMQAVAIRGAVSIHLADSALPGLDEVGIDPYRATSPTSAALREIQQQETRSDQSQILREPKVEKLIGSDDIEHL